MLLYLVYFEKGGCHCLVKEQQVCVRNINATRLETIASTQRRASYTEQRQREEERFNGREGGRREKRRKKRREKRKKKRREEEGRRGEGRRILS